MSDFNRNQFHELNKTFSWKTTFIVLLVGLIILSFVKPVVVEEEDDEGNAFLQETNEEPLIEPKGSTKRPPTTRLQIGIKKRPDTCEKKSKKGDFMHIHYRVRFIL